MYYANPIKCFIISFFESLLNTPSISRSTISAAVDDAHASRSTEWLWLICCIQKRRKIGSVRCALLGWHLATCRQAERYRHRRVHFTAKDVRVSDWSRGVRAWALFIHKISRCASIFILLRASVLPFACTSKYITRNNIIGQRRRIYIKIYN